MGQVVGIVGTGVEWRERIGTPLPLTWKTWIQRARERESGRESERARERERERARVRARQGEGCSVKGVG